MVHFIDTGPKAESCWRGVVLLGRNVQSYKFALARTLLDWAAAGRNEASLEDLAAPFAQQLCEHLRHADKQGTPARSQFLDACRRSNQGEMSLEELRAVTVRLGFNNVLDAFHIVSRAPVPAKFFDVSGTGERRVLHLTDEAMALATGEQHGNLVEEVEARWRLVEAAWELGASPAAISTVAFDDDQEVLSIRRNRGRAPITGVRGAVSGYQKGRCFYCSRPIEVGGTLGVRVDVDHFVPHRLQHTLFLRGPNLDGIWNLVLACQECNRGRGGKHDSVPVRSQLERLWRRNEYYITSYRPLRETLIAQTGSDAEQRRRFLLEVWRDATAAGVTTWEPSLVAEEVL